MIEYFKSEMFYETIILILIIAGVLFISRLIDKKYLKAKSANAKWYRSAKMIIDFVRAVIVAILLLAILSVNGVRVGKYLTSLGVIGVILSFALQDILKDIIMGMSIMLEGYYKVGDCVVYHDRVGKIISFNIKSTKMFMIDDESTLTVSNRNITEIAVASDWFDIDIPIGYDIDLHFSRSICRECAKKIERLRYVYSCDFLNTQELGDSSIKYKLRVHCLTEKQKAVRRNAIAVVQDVFYEHNAPFPYNVLVLHNGDMKPDEKKEIKTVIPESSQGSAHKRKYDYELGRGAAKSKVCQFDDSDVMLQKAISETERYAASENLSKTMKLRMRLISEELLAIAKTFPRKKNATFYIERDDSDYDICFEADARISKKMRDSLVEVASDNRNAAYTGVSGLLTQAIDSMIIMSIRDKSGVNDVAMNTMEESIGKADEDYRWSYKVYKEKEQSSSIINDNEAEINDKDLEISVLSRLSDDIKISVRANHVSLRILVKSIDED